MSLITETYRLHLKIGRAYREGRICEDVYKDAIDALDEIDEILTRGGEEK
jgi:hypothetical protein